MRRRSPRTTALAVGLVLGCALVAVGCSSGSSSNDATSSDKALRNAVCVSVGNRATATSALNVTLNEWAIGPSTPSAPAGNITFNASNHGDEPHELVIIKGVGPSRLPKDKDGALDETKLPAGALVGEINPFAGGQSCDGTFALGAGDYTLVCNITQQLNAKTVSHLAKGMVSTFTVK